MTISTMGLLHPGEMGASVGAALIAAGARVVWSRDGRSAATAKRAEAVGATGLDSLRALVAEVDRIVCVCPPASAHEVALSVRAAGFAGRYLDHADPAPHSPDPRDD